jgi:hypothetical protein
MDDEQDRERRGRAHEERRREEEREDDPGRREELSRTQPWRPVAAWLAIAVPLYVPWLAFTYSHSEDDMLLGASIALVSSAVAVLAGLSGRVRFWPRARWLARTAVVPWWIVRDSTLVVASLPLRRHGRTRRAYIDPGDDDGRGTARRAIAKGVGSAAPNLYVVVLDREKSSVTMHELSPGDDLPPVELVQDD